jgi:hypothetical protein
MPFKVLVDDNFHYMNEAERYELGTYQTLEAALHAARTIVEDYLQSVYEPGMTTDTLLGTYLCFGEDPFIVPTDPGPSKILFSARDYARHRAEEMCRPEPPAPGLPDAEDSAGQG